MKDARPLVLDTDSDEVRELLRSAELDEPPNGAMRRVLTRAGVGMGIAAVVTTATSAGVASQTGTAAVSAAKVTPLLIGKWLALAAFVGGGAVAVVHVARPLTTAMHPAAAVTREATPTAPPAADSEKAPAPEEPAAVADTRVPAAAVPAPHALKASSAPTDINGEIAAIAQARSELDKGNARAGLAALDRYQQDYPHGALAPEATVLRIEALLESGDRARAKSLGEAFLKAHPKSPHAQRVRSLIGAGN
jgi:TolA-binding protein